MRVEYSNWMWQSKQTKKQLLWNCNVFWNKVVKRSWFSCPLRCHNCSYAAIWKVAGFAARTANDCAGLYVCKQMMDYLISLKYGEKCEGVGGTKGTFSAAIFLLIWNECYMTLARNSRAGRLMRLQAVHLKLMICYKGFSPFECVLT